MLQYLINLIDKVFFMLNTRVHIPANVTTNLVVGREYYYWDHIVGRIDEGLAEVVSIDTPSDRVEVLNLFTNQMEKLSIVNLEWEVNAKQHDPIPGFECD